MLQFLRVYGEHTEHVLDKCLQFSSLRSINRIYFYVCKNDIYQNFYEMPLRQGLSAVLFAD